MHIIQIASMIVPLRTMEQMAVAKPIPSIAEMQMSKSLMFVSMIFTVLFGDLRRNRTSI